jgi:hypothetical protein
LFGVVVVGTDLVVVEESEHLLAMAPQAFEEALGIGVVAGGVDECIKALMNRDYTDVMLWGGTG